MAFTPRDFIAGFIDAHEGGLSLHPQDNGNWFDPKRYAAGLPQKRGLGVLVGSKYGVTAYTLATYRKVKNISAKDMAALTRAEAIDIGVALYYLQPHFDKLPWNRVTMSVLDKAWASGPGRAIMMLQKLIGVTQDGKLGDGTKAAFEKFIAAYGEEGAAFRWCDARIAFDTSLTGPGDPDNVFLNGWNNRSRSFLPGTKWWKEHKV